jgi:hypothetical protein
LRSFFTASPGDASSGGNFGAGSFGGGGGGGGGGAFSSSSSARPVGLVAELLDAPTILGVLGVLWRYLSMNVLVESLEPYDAEVGEVRALLNAYNLVALVSALLLSMGMGPFMDMARVVEASGDTPMTRFANVCIMCVMGLSLANLAAVPLLGFYISSVDRALRHAELRNFPLFGFPLLLLLSSVLFGLLWLIGHVYLSLPSGYAWFAIVSREQADARAAGCGGRRATDIVCLRQRSAPLPLKLTPPCSPLRPLYITRSPPPPPPPPPPPARRRSFAPSSLLARRCSPTPSSSGWRACGTASGPRRPRRCATSPQGSSRCCLRARCRSRRRRLTRRTRTDLCNLARSQHGRAGGVAEVLHRVLQYRTLKRKDIFPFTGGCRWH